MATYFEETLLDAQKNQVSYTDYTIKLFEKEAGIREEKSLERRLKAARLPLNHDLGQYDHAVDNGVNKTRLNQLRELNWLDQIYNIVLMGPSGTGKTFIAAGLCYDAIKNGYKAYFRTMDDVINVLNERIYPFGND